MDHPLWPLWYAEFGAKARTHHAFSLDLWLQDAKMVAHHNKQASVPYRMKLGPYAGVCTLELEQEIMGAEPLSADDEQELLQYQVQNVTPITQTTTGGRSGLVTFLTPAWPVNNAVWVDYRYFVSAAGQRIQILTPIKNQNNCGSCSIFSVMAQLEAFIALNTGIDARSLAVQPLLNCFNDANQQHQCMGAVTSLVLASLCDGQPRSFTYASNSDGGGIIDYDFNDPAVVQQCNSIEQDCGGWFPSPLSNCNADMSIRRCNSALKCSGIVNQCGCSPSQLCRAGSACTPPFTIMGSLLGGWNDIDRQTKEQYLADTVSWWGPCVVSIYASSRELMNYAGGVFVPSLSFGQAIGITGPKATNHAVLCVGFSKSASSRSFWILRNSWGQAWGEGGYFRLVMGIEAYGPLGALSVLSSTPFELQQYQPA